MRTRRPLKRLWLIVDRNGEPYGGEIFTSRRPAAVACQKQYDLGDRVVAYDLDLTTVPNESDGVKGDSR